MATTTATHATTLSTKLRLGLILALVTALLFATQAGTLARERDETPEDTRRQEQPRNRHGDSSMNDDPADNGNSMNDDPADTGGKWSEEDDDRPGTITSPIEFDLIAGQSKLPVVKVVVSDLQNAETLASSVPKK